MEILLGVLGLGLLACALALIVALFDDGFGRRTAAILLARAEAREAYRERYRYALAQREEEFRLRPANVQES